MMSRTIANKGLAFLLGLTFICPVVCRVASAAGVPEPGITLYGQILADDGSLVTQGRLTWTFTRGDGNPLRVTATTELFPMGDGLGTTYSYWIHIPAEMPAGSKPISSNHLPVTSNAVTYLREATLDGAFTWIVSDLTTTTFSSAERGKLERVDLGTGVGGPPDVPSSPSPFNGEMLIPLEVTLDWADTARAETYDVYLWQGSSLMRPSVPTVSGLTGSLFQPAFSLRPDSDYLWQVIAQNSKGSAAGPIWTFRTGFGGDLQKLLEYLLGKRSLTFQEQSLFDLNGDRILDIADFVLGLKRSFFQGKPLESPIKSASLVTRRTVAIDSEWVDPDTTVSVVLPVDIFPGCDSVAGVNLHVEADPLVVKFLGVRANRANDGEDLHFYSPYAGVVNVVFFTNPVNVLKVSGSRILLLDLQVHLPRELEISRIRLTVAGLSDINGYSASDTLKADGSIQSRGRLTSSRNWELYH